MAVFEVSFSIRKEFKETKSMERFSCTNTRAWKQVNYHDSICLFCKFIIAKSFKQEVNDELSICVDECSPYDLSITGDRKIHQCHVIKR